MRDGPYTRRVGRVSGATRIVLVECPACGADLTSAWSPRYHIAEHKPEDFGLSPDGGEAGDGAAVADEPLVADGGLRELCVVATGEGSVEWADRDRAAARQLLSDPVAALYYIVEQADPTGLTAGATIARLSVWPESGDLDEIELTAAARAGTNATERDRLRRQLAQAAGGELVTDGGRSVDGTDHWQVVEITGVGIGEMWFNVVADELSRDNAETRASQRMRHVAVPMPFNPDPPAGIGERVDDYEREVVEE